jgi:hypothetical protein
MRHFLFTVLAAVTLLTMVPGAAHACNAAQGTIQIGVNWVNNACRGGRDADCIDVAKSVARTIRPLRNCPNVNRAEVDGILRDINRMASGAPAASREADRRYRDRMRPDPGHAARMRRDGARNSCHANVSVQCGARCGGDPTCQSACTGQNMWQCN